jgi:hypothetical protein
MKPKTNNIIFTIIAIQFNLNIYKLSITYIFYYAK